MSSHYTVHQTKRRRWAAGIVLPVVAVPLLTVAPASPVSAQAPPPPVTFEYTGAAQTWLVPAGVTQATFDVYGAVGGDLKVDVIKGGLGGRATATLVVTPGATITIVVGGAGEDIDVCQSGPVPGGFNGGGDGGVAVCDGASGGGASDVRIDGAALVDRVLVAGGGGGASTGQSPCGGHGGGPGGGLTGGDGQCGGGSGGNQTGTSGSGQPGIGSAGGFGFLGGGGGGGGYFGGAGGAGGPGSMSFGGGGGSGFGPAGVAFQTGVRDGNGRVIVTPLPSPAQQLSQLEAAVRGAGRAGPGLAALVRAARRAIEVGQPGAACSLLQSFAVSVGAFAASGQLTQAQAAQFTADATRIRAGLGCG